MTRSTCRKRSLSTFLSLMEAGDKTLLAENPFLTSLQTIMYVSFNKKTLGELMRQPAFQALTRYVGCNVSHISQTYLT